MMTAGQRLGRCDADTWAVRPFELARAIKRARLAVGDGGLDVRGAGFLDVRPRFGGRATEQQRDAPHFQFVAHGLPRLRAQRDVRYLPPRLQGFWSRSPAATLESMARRLLARGRILAARKLIQAVPSDQVVDEPLRRLRLVLAEPVVRRRMPAGARRSGDVDWLRRNAGNYSGKWVALVDGTLLAADDSLSGLRRKLRDRAPDAKPVLHRL